ncbi:hypothetical protein GCM10007977_079300 [Dactylosporangium sucinum]|uniref:Uncharacterized protein n=1 Tax=Dactylosporangium sucinum TaxID=1424081 RepID=A0A917UAC1_9ACTN|nr:hypothetical protein GCM10007977_079300 [Dactylosporangium sucinum]
MRDALSRKGRTALRQSRSACAHAVADRAPQQTKSGLSAAHQRQPTRRWPTDPGLRGAQCRAGTIIHYAGNRIRAIGTVAEVAYAAQRPAEFSTEALTELAARRHVAGQRTGRGPPRFGPSAGAPVRTAIASYRSIKKVILRSMHSRPSDYKASYVRFYEYCRRRFIPGCLYFRPVPSGASRTAGQGPGTAEHVWNAPESTMDTVHAGARRDRDVDRPPQRRHECCSPGA